MAWLHCDIIERIKYSRSRYRPRQRWRGSIATFPFVRFLTFANIRPRQRWRGSIATVLFVIPDQQDIPVHVRDGVAPLRPRYRNCVGETLTPVHVRDGVAPLRLFGWFFIVSQGITVHVRDGVAPLRLLKKNPINVPLLTVHVRDGVAPLRLPNCIPIDMTKNSVHVRDGVAPLRRREGLPRLSLRLSVHVRDGVAPLRLFPFSYTHIRVLFRPRQRWRGSIATSELVRDENGQIIPSTSEMAWLHCDFFVFFFDLAF